MKVDILNLVIINHYKNEILIWIKGNSCSTPCALVSLRHYPFQEQLCDEGTEACLESHRAILHLRDMLLE